MTPPPVTPAMIFSDMKMYSRTVGRNTMITAANMPPHWPVYFIALMMFWRPTPTGAMLSLLVKIRAMKNSFHTDMKLKMVTVMMLCRSQLNSFVGHSK